MVRQGATGSGFEKSLPMSSPASSSPYKPLPQDKDCTRLMKVEPAKSHNDPIICTLFEAAFGDRPKYDALSYVWGHGSEHYDIILNGATIRIRQNLRDALLYLRNHAPATLYWIDALCINQDDVLERSKQVRIMHHIYSRAQTVVVWLGARYVKYEVSIPDLHGLRHDKVPNTEADSDLSADRAKNGLPAGQQSADVSEQRKMAKDLYDDGYWNRLWIVQEIGRAKNIKVCFGDAAVIEWGQFMHFITMFNLGNQGPVRLNHQRQEKYSGANTFLRLLEDHQNALCEDRRDKVYGLVGLASDARGFNIDYEKSPIQIWTDVMEFLNERKLFGKKDIVGVGCLVKHLLMGAECSPMEQISRLYAPEEGANKLAITPKDSRAFKLHAGILGCVIHVGPHPSEIVGVLDKVDSWVEHVQANYENDLRYAHKESDLIIQYCLDADDIILSKKCFDYRSTVQWSVKLGHWNPEHNGLRNQVHCLGLQSKPHDHANYSDVPTEHTNSSNSYLFQMKDMYEGNTPWKMGLASRDVRHGDLICSLGWPRRAVIVRLQEVDTVTEQWSLQVVGTAIITRDLEAACLNQSQDPDLCRNKSMMTLFLDASMIFILSS